MSWCLPFRLWANLFPYLVVKSCEKCFKFSIKVGASFRLALIAWPSRVIAISLNILPFFVYTCSPIISLFSVLLCCFSTSLGPRFSSFYADTFPCMGGFPATKYTFFFFGLFFLDEC